MSSITISSNVIILASNTCLHVHVQQYVIIMKATVMKYNNNTAVARNIIS